MSFLGNLFNQLGRVSGVRYFAITPIISKDIITPKSALFF